MSEATTGVPEANASVSTIPKLSPPSDGAHSMSASPSSFHLSASSHLARDLDALGVEQQRLDLLGRGAGDGEPRGHAHAAQRLEGAQQHGQALALLGAAHEDDPQRVVAGARRPAAPRDRSTPFGTMR